MAAKPKVTLQMLKAVAEDFNSFMFAGDELDKLMKMKAPALQKEIIEYAAELDESDTISAETAATLALLNLKHEAQIAEAEEEEVDPETEEEDESTIDPPTDDEEEIEEELEEEQELDEEEEPKFVVKKLISDVKKSKKLDDIKAIAKARGIRIPPPFLKDLAKLKAYVTGKLDGSSVSVAKPKKKKSDAPRYTRDMAVIEAIKHLCVVGATQKEIMDESDRIVVENGGKSNPTATNVNRYTIGGLVGFGVLIKKRDMYKLTK